MSEHGAPVSTFAFEVCIVACFKSFEKGLPNSRNCALLWDVQFWHVRNEKALSSYAQVVRRVEPDVEVRIVHFARKVPVDISGLCELLQQAKSGSPAMSILFPVTGNGGSQSETNLQLRDVLARHHLQYGFHVVNFIICPTVKEALEAPIEEWKREFAEFAEWSWEIKDSAGTVGLWRGQVDRQREASLVSTVGAVLALLAGALAIAAAYAVAAACAIAFVLTIPAVIAIAAARAVAATLRIAAALAIAAVRAVAATLRIAAVLALLAGALAVSTGLDIPAFVDIVQDTIVFTATVIVYALDALTVATAHAVVAAHDVAAGHAVGAADANFAAARSAALWAAYSDRLAAAQPDTFAAAWRAIADASQAFVAFERDRVAAVRADRVAATRRKLAVAYRDKVAAVRADRVAATRRKLAVVADAPTLAATDKFAAKRADRVAARRALAAADRVAAEWNERVAAQRALAAADRGAAKRAHTFAAEGQALAAAYRVAAARAFAAPLFSAAQAGREAGHEAGRVVGRVVGRGVALTALEVVHSALATVARSATHLEDRREASRGGERSYSVLFHFHQSKSEAVSGIDLGSVWNSLGVVLVPLVNRNLYYQRKFGWETSELRSLKMLRIQ